MQPTTTRLGGKTTIGKTAIVTGGSRGIGRGCAIALAEDGADVVVNYLAHQQEAESAVREIEELGRRAFAFRANVADRAAVEAMVNETLTRFGRLDIMVANAYRSIREPFLEMSVTSLEETLAVSLLGTFHCCQLAARAMVALDDARELAEANQTGNGKGARQGGKIVVIGSVHAEHQYPRAASYNMAKSGVVAMAMTAASELAQYHINVNVLHPGWIDTPGERHYYSEEQLIEEGKRIPWGRLGTAHEIGRVAAFLASADASYVTGAVLRADGAILLGLS